MNKKISWSIKLLFLQGLIALTYTAAQSGDIIKNFYAHNGKVKSIAYTSDGKYLVSAGTDGSINFWSTTNYTRINSIKFNGFAVVSDDGTLTAASGLDKNNKIWYTNNGKEIFRTGKLIDYRRSIAISPDNKIFAGSSFSEIQLFDITAGKLKKIIAGHNGWINSIRFSLDGKRLITGSTDMSAIIWNVESGEIIWQLKGHLAGINVVKFSPDGKLAATGSSDGMIKIWDTERGKEIVSVQKNRNIIKTLAFSPCGRYLVSGGTDKTIKVWQSVNGCEICSRPAGDAIVNEVSFSPDGRLLAVCGEDNFIKIFDFEKLTKE